jgi:hypothetical protein
MQKEIHKAFEKHQREKKWIFFLNLRKIENYIMLAKTKHRLFTNLY